MVEKLYNFKQIEVRKKKWRKKERKKKKNMELEVKKMKEE